MRTVSCQQVQSDGSTVTLLDSDCADLPKPNSTSLCIIRECGVWKTGEWASCSEDCGNGERQREVYCSNTTDTTGARIDDSNCEHLQRPSDKGPCNNGICYYDWYHGSEWSKVRE